MSSESQDCSLSTVDHGHKESHGQEKELVDIRNTRKQFSWFVHSFNKHLLFTILVIDLGTADGTVKQQQQKQQRESLSLRHLPSSSNSRVPMGFIVINKRKRWRHGLTIWNNHLNYRQNTVMMILFSPRS